MRSNPSQRTLHLAIALIAVATLVASACGGNADASQPTELTQVRPPMAIAGQSAVFTLIGSGFTTATPITIAGQKLTDTVINSGQIMVNVPASDFAKPGSVTLAAGAARWSLPVAAPGSVAATANPQVALYSFQSPLSAEIAIQFGPTSTYGLSTWQRPVASGGRAVIFVAGMMANTTYHLRAVIRFPDGAKLDGPDQSFTTGAPSPGLLPALGSPSPASGSPTGGVDMLNFYAPTVTVPVAVTDTAGHVLWYYQLRENDLELAPSKLGKDGNIYLLLEAPKT